MQNYQRMHGFSAQLVDSALRDLPILPDQSSMMEAQVQVTPLVGDQVEVKIIHTFKTHISDDARSFIMNADCANGAFSIQSRPTSSDCSPDNCLPEESSLAVVPSSREERCQQPLTWGDKHSF